MSLGLPQHRVKVHPYDPEWALLYAQEAQRLQTALGDSALDIQHIGSTAIPGMSAKPIIDIAVAVQDFDQAFDTVPLMNELGYNFRGEVGVKRRHFFMLGRPRTHHIHMLEHSSQAWKHRIGFRDFLIAHPKSAKEYEELKKRLAAEFPRDIASYSDGKEAFIDSVLAQLK